MADYSEEISQFTSVTGIAPDQARFFVESAGGDIATALSTYYDTVNHTNAGAPTPVGAPGNSAPPPPVPTGPRTLGGQAAEDLPEAWKRSGGGGGGTGGGSRPSGPGRITGLSELLGSGGGDEGAHAGHGHDNEDEDDQRPPQPEGGLPDLYAGGGRGSALNVQDPNQNKGGKPKGVVGDILKKAAQAGPGPERPESGPSRPNYFGGSANTLGSEDTPSRAVPDPSQRPPPSRNFPTGLSVPGAFGDDEEEDEAEEVERHLTFWKDGFSVEDGPLLRYEDNKETLEAINNGRAPLDLLGAKLNQRVTLRVQKRLEEDYIPPPKKPLRPFEGSGNRLGSPVPGGIAAGGSGIPSAPEGVGVGNSSEDRVQAARVLFEVDQAQPATSVQIRLGDGSRMVTRFNLTHTVRDIRAQIQASNPGLAARPYVLQTTFPSRDLTDETMSIADAGVAGSVVVQRFL